MSLSLSLCPRQFVRPLFSSSHAAAVWRAAKALPPAPAGKAPLPYFVHRSGTNNLPVYLDRKRGGNLKLTLIRKLEGNLNALKNHLIEELKLPPEKVAINGQAKQIIIKGHMKPLVTKFLNDKGF